MTEIYTGYPGERSTKVVGPKDSYHEPYPGYWNKGNVSEVNTKAPANNAVELKSTVQS